MGMSTFATKRQAGPTTRIGYTLKLLAAGRMPNDPSVRSVLSRRAYGVLGPCVAKRPAGVKKPRFDRGLVLPGGKEADAVLNSRALPRRARERRVRYQQCLSRRGELGAQVSA